MLFTHLLRVRDVFNINIFIVFFFFFFFFFFTSTYCLLLFYFLSVFEILCYVWDPDRRRKIFFFCLDLLSYLYFFFRLLHFFCQFCMDVVVAFPFGNSFIILFSVAIYSHANECSIRFTVFESTVICCEFFLS